MEKSDSAFSALKDRIKKYPRFYRALVYVFGAQPQNTSAFAFVETLPKDAVILNIGSGSRRLREGTTNIDVIPFTGVDLVASADALPYQSESVDAVVLDNVLEHTKNPHEVIVEVLRVLKRGGKAYIAVPFVIPYHSSPGDYYRWSEEGLRELLRDFTEEELKIQYGPSAAFTMVLSEWLALLFSFNSKRVYGVLVLLFTIVTAPLKLFDYLLSRYHYAHSMPLSFYFIGRK